MEPFLPSFLSFSLAADFSQEKPGQVFSGEVALGRIGTWRGVDRFCLEKFELIGVEKGPSSGSIVSVFCIYTSSTYTASNGVGTLLSIKCRSVDGS